MGSARAFGPCTNYYRAVIGILFFVLSTLTIHPSAKGQPLSADATRTFDSLLVHVAQGKIDSLIGFYKLSSSDVRVVSSAEILSVMKGLHYPNRGGSSDIIRIGRAGAIVTYPESPSGFIERMTYRLEGDLIAHQGSLTIPFSVLDSLDVRTVTPEQLEVVPYGKYGVIEVVQTEPRSFWDRILQPALVIVGAAAIVALFFIIRS